MTVTRPGSEETVRQARTPRLSGHLVWKLPAGKYHVKKKCMVGKTVTVQLHKHHNRDAHVRGEVGQASEGTGGERSSCQGAAVPLHRPYRPI